MDIYTILFILCVSVAGTAFLSHAIGYRRGIVGERRRREMEWHQRRLANFSSIYGKMGAGAIEADVSETNKAVLKGLIDEHNERIGL